MTEATTDQVPMVRSAMSLCMPGRQRPVRQLRRTSWSTQSATRLSLSSLALGSTRFAYGVCPTPGALKAYRRISVQGVALKDVQDRVCKPHEVRSAALVSLSGDGPGLLPEADLPPEQKAHLVAALTGEDEGQD